MNFIKIFNITPDKPEIITMARRLHKSKNEVLGACVRLWCWVDEHCNMDELDEHNGLTAREYDSIMGLRGMTKQLFHVGWIAQVACNGPERYCLTDFHGRTSKWRANRARKKREDAEIYAPPMSDSTQELAREIAGSPELVEDCRQLGVVCTDIINRAVKGVQND